MELSLALTLPATAIRGGAVLLPSENRVGVWYADEYTAANGNKVIPNADSATAVAANLFAAPRRLFNNEQVWSKSNVTIVDDAETAPDDSTEASTFSCTASNWTVRPTDTTNLPAGTYTIAANVKRNAGSDQSFAFSGDNTGTRSDVMTATSAWQRFSYTFTTGAPAGINRVSMCSSDGSTAAELQVCDLELYAGSSDLGPQTLAGHMYLGRSAYTSIPSAASGWLDLSGGGTALIQMPSTTTLTTFTAMAVVSKTAAGSAYQAFLSKAQAYAQFTAYTEQSGRPDTLFQTGSNVYGQIDGGLWALLNDGAHVIGCRYDDTTISFWLDDIQLLQAAVSRSNVDVRDFWVGIVNDYSLNSGCKINSIALWSSALTDAEYRNAYTALKNRAAQSSITLSEARVLVAEGDSITGGETYCYPYVYGDNADPSVLGANLAVSGSSLATLVARQDAVTAIIPPNPGSRKFIASVLIGANDLRTYPGASDAAAAAAYTTALFEYYATLKAAGFLVVGCTILPVSGTANDSEHNARRAIVNANIVAAVGDEIDAVADFADDATMGIDDSYTTTAEHWTDGVHPDASGHAILEPIYRAAVDAL